MRLGNGAREGDDAKKHGVALETCQLIEQITFCSGIVVAAIKRKNTANGGFSR